MFEPAESQTARVDSWDVHFLPIENAVKRFWLATSRFSFSKRLAKRRLRWVEMTDAQRSIGILELSTSIRRDGFTDTNIAEALAWVDATVGKSHTSAIPGMADVVRRMLKGFVVEADLDRRRANLLVASICTLTRQPVHLVIERNAELTSVLDGATALVEQLGLTIACVDASQNKRQRQKAYQADIVVGHAHQFAQDSLHDRMLMSSKNALQLEIEQLRTNQNRSDHAITRGLGVLVAENIEETLFEEIDVPVVIYQAELGSAQKTTYQQAIEYARALDRSEDFNVDEAVRSVALTDAGKLKLADLCSGSKNKLWLGTKSRHYLVIQALFSEHVLSEEKDYQVEDDGFGSLASGISWSRELLCLLAIKHGVERDYSGYQLARMSIHQLVCGYGRVYGSGGVASLYARELRTLYGLAVVRSEHTKINQRRKNVVDRQDLIRTVVNDMADESCGPCLVVAAEMYEDIVEEAQKCDRAFFAADSSGSVRRIDGQSGAGLVVHEAGIEANASLIKTAVSNNGLAPRSVGRVVVCDSPSISRKIIKGLVKLEIDRACPCVIYSLDSVGRFSGFGWWNNSIRQHRSETRIAQQELAERLQGVQMDEYLARLLAFSGKIDY